MASIGEISSMCGRATVGFSGDVKCYRRRAWVRASSRAAAGAATKSMYEVLAVGEAAGPEEIKAAYRRAAQRWHPDACHGGADRFMRAREAYEVLSDPERRRSYDAQMRCGVGAGGLRSRAARPAGFADWEVQLAGLQWRVAEQGETWGSRMRRVAEQPPSSYQHH